MRTSNCRLFAAGLCVAALFLSHTAFAEAVTILPGTTTNITDATIGDFAGGITFAATTEEAPTPGVVEFNTTAAPTMTITGKGTVKKTSTGAWTLSAAQTGFTGDFVIEAGS